MRDRAFRYLLILVAAALTAATIKDLLTAHAWVPLIYLSIKDVAACGMIVYFIRCVLVAQGTGRGEVRYVATIAMYSVVLLSMLADAVASTVR